MNEAENRKIAEWVGVCWPDIETEVDDEGICQRCGIAIEMHQKHPNYVTDAFACLDLLEAVRVKGYAVWMNNATGPWCVSSQPIGTVGAEGDFLADTLPAAVAAAVLKLIDQEKQA